MARPNFQIIPNGKIPGGWRLATCTEVRNDMDLIKSLFGNYKEWHICKLMDGKISGPGYGFKIEEGQVGQLGHMIVIEIKGQNFPTESPQWDTPSYPYPLQFRVANKGASAPGWRLATHKEVQNSLHEVKLLLFPYKWHVCALSDGSISGPGNNYSLTKGGNTANLPYVLLVNLPKKEFKITFNGVAPFGWRIASYNEVYENFQDIKELLRPHQWHICALADGHIFGSGFDYELKQMPHHTKQHLSHMIITKPE